MPRVLVAFVFVGWMASAMNAAEPSNFADPLNVAAEKSKIDYDYNSALLKRIPWEEAEATRNEALSQLAAAAEQAHSTEYLTLAEIYAILGRHEDVVRTSPLALEKNPDNFPCRASFLKSLCALKRSEEIAAEFQKLIDQKVDVFNTQDYLRTVPPVVEAVIKSMLADGDTADSGKAFSVWLGQLQMAEEQLKRLPGDRTGPDTPLARARALADALEAELRGLGIEVQHPDPNAAKEALAAIARASVVKEPIKRPEFDTQALQQAPQSVAPIDQAKPKPLPNSDQLRNTLDTQTRSTDEIANIRNLATLKSAKADAPDRTSLSTPSNSVAPKRPTRNLARPSKKSSESPAEMIKLRSAMFERSLINKPLPSFADLHWVNGPIPLAEDLQGKVLLVEFFPLDDDQGQPTLQLLQSWQEKNAEQNIAILGMTWRAGLGWNAAAKKLQRMPNLTTDQENAAVAEAVKHYGLKFPVAVAPDVAMLKTRYTIKGDSLQFVLVNKLGVVQAIFVSADEANLEKNLHEILGPK